MPFKTTHFSVEQTVSYEKKHLCLSKAHAYVKSCNLKWKWKKNTIHCRERCLCVCAEGVMAPIKQWVRRSGRIFTPRSELWILHVSDFVWGLKCIIIFQLYHERDPQLLAVQDINCCVLEFFHLWQISNNLVTFYLWVWTGCLSQLISSECFFFCLPWHKLLGISHWRM